MSSYSGRRRRRGRPSNGDTAVTVSQVAAATSGADATGGVVGAQTAALDSAEVTPASAPAGSTGGKPGTSRKRAGLGIVDQLLFSFTNFVLTVLVARSVSATEFGAYSLAIATYLLGTAVMRGLTSEALVVRFSATDRKSWRVGASAANGASLSLGLGSGAILVGASFAFHGTLGTTILALGVLFPGLVLQDYLRFAALALGRPGLALLNDATQAAVQFALAGLLIAEGDPKVWELIGAWGIGAYGGALVGIATLRLMPRIGRTMDWFRKHGDLAGRYALDDLAAQGSQQATTYVLAGVAGLNDAGALRGAQTVFGPPSILNLGVQAAIIPELVRALRRGPGRLRRDVVLLGLGLGVIGLVWGVVALIIPAHVGRALFGGTWKQARPLLIYYLVTQVANGIRVGPQAGLRALGAANRTLVARSVVIVLGLVLQVAGAIVKGATGVAAATAVATPLQAIVWWWQFEVGLGDQRRDAARDRRRQAWDDLVASAPEYDGQNIGPRTERGFRPPILDWNL